MLIGEKIRRVDSMEVMKKMDGDEEKWIAVGKEKGK